MVHVASSRRSHGRQAKYGRFDGVGCGTVEVGPNYHSIVVVFISAHRGILVFYFSHINKNHRAVVGVSELDPLSEPLYLCFSFFAWCGCASCLREERREVRDLPKFSKEWEDVWVVSTPCKLLIRINVVVLLN
jgi:hypothetical protein